MLMTVYKFEFMDLFSNFKIFYLPLAAPNNHYTIILWLYFQYHPPSILKRVCLISLFFLCARYLKRNINCCYLGTTIIQKRANTRKPTNNGGVEFLSILLITKLLGEISTVVITNTIIAVFKNRRFLSMYTMLRA